MTRELRDVPLRPAGGVCACGRAHSDRQQVSAGARASSSWIGGRRRPTRGNSMYSDYCVKLDEELSRPRRLEMSSIICARYRDSLVTSESKATGTTELHS
jgi:hypothetical protein